MKVSIVVPLFNEEESLATLLDGIDAVFADRDDTYDVILVDDGSTDGSFDVCRSLFDTYPGRIQVFRFSRNYGKSAALSVGIEHAGGDVVVTMDADLQDDPAAIPEMLAKLDEGWDLVSGWKKKRYDPLGKTIPSRIWNVLTSAIAGIRLHDFNCGFKAYRANAAKSLDIYGERHRYLPALAHWDGYRVTEIPVPHHPRLYGKSKYGVMRMVNGLLDMLTLVFLRRYLSNPLHFFGLLGMLFFFAGAAVMTYFGIDWVITRQMRLRPLVLLSLGSIIVGIQFISIGLVGEMITNSFPAKKYKIRDTLE
jgi:glycosyltransferase involved in cell wall biosynthesis